MQASTLTKEINLELAMYQFYRVDDSFDLNQYAVFLDPLGEYA